MGVVHMIKSLMRWAIINSSSDDDKALPIHQIAYMGKVSDAVAWYPYGYHANPSKDTLAIMISMGSNPENQVVLPGSPKERLGVKLPTPLGKDEILIFNPATQSYVHFLKDGTIDIDSKKDINIRVAGNVLADVEGNMTADVEGNINLDAAGTAVINAASTAILSAVGKVTVKGAGTVEIDGSTLVDILAALVKASDGGAVQSLCNENFLNWAKTHSHGIGPPTTLPVIGVDTTIVLKGQ